MDPTTTTTTTGPSIEAPPPSAPSSTVQRATSTHDSRFISDTWLYLRAAAAQPPFLAWHDPSRGVSFVAWGTAQRLDRHAAQRIAAGSPWCSSRDERWIGNAAPPPGVPLAVGGFSFAAAPSGGAWRRWPSSSWFIPRYLAYRIEGVGSGLIARRARRPLPPSSERTVVPFQATPRPRWRPEPDRDGYRALVRSAVNDIAAGSLQKVVAARRVRCDAPPHAEFDAVASALAVRETAPGGSTAFAMSLDGTTTFVGATPETLVSVRARHLETHALAGTSELRLDTNGRALLASRKDRHEHALVVDGIMDALAPLCAELRHEAPRVVTAGAVQHLMSPIRGTLREGRGVLDALARMHPTAALCGTPRAQAARWIAEREPQGRGWYGAPLGWIGGAGDGVMAVAIRSMLLSRREAVAFAGAGIVADSDPDAEWRETEAKLRDVTAALRLRSGGIA